MIFKPVTTEAALGTSTGASSNVSSSEFVKLFNSANQNTQHLVTLEKADGTDIGTFTIGGHESIIIHKEPTDKLFAADAAVLACGVVIVEGSQPKVYRKPIK